MSHADECHPQLLADSVEVTLHLLCQGTGGFIKHCGHIQNTTLILCLL